MWQKDINENWTDLEQCDIMENGWEFNFVEGENYNSYEMLSWSTKIKININPVITNH